MEPRQVVLVAHTQILHFGIFVSHTELHGVRRFTYRCTQSGSATLLLQVCSGVKLTSTTGGRQEMVLRG